MYNQRDIILVPFPYSDLTSNKQRPALIISNDKLNKTEDRICCLITSNIHPEDIIIEKKDFEKGKLPFKSSIRPHRIFTVNEKIIKKKICTVSKTLHNRLFSKINDFIK